MKQKSTGKPKVQKKPVEQKSTGKPKVQETGKREATAKAVIDEQVGVKRKRASGKKGKRPKKKKSVNFN